MRATILCVLLLAVAISGNLQTDLDDIASHLPMEQLELIGQKYIASGLNIGTRLENIQTHPHEEIVKRLLEIKEVQRLVEYLNRNGIDADKIMDYGVQKVQAFYRKLLEQSAAGQTGSDVSITGNFIADCMQVISSSDISNVISEKLKTSEEFAHFAAAVNDNEFKNLFYSIVNSKGFSADCTDCKDIKVRGFFQNAWNSIKNFFG